MCRILWKFKDLRFADNHENLWICGQVHIKNLRTYDSGMSPRICGLKTLLFSDEPGCRVTQNSKTGMHILQRRPNGLRSVSINPLSLGCSVTDSSVFFCCPEDRMLLLATHLDQVVEQKQLLPYPPPSPPTHPFTIPFFFLQHLSFH